MDTLLVICTSLLLTSTNHLTDDAYELPMATRNKPSAMFTDYAEYFTAVDGEL